MSNWTMKIKISLIINNNEQNMKFSEALLEDKMNLPIHNSEVIFNLNGI